MFLTGTAIDEPGQKEPTKDEQKKEREALEQAQEGQEGRRRRRRSALAPSWSKWRCKPSEPEFFSRSIVNRLWHRFFGHGLVMPLDQMHTENPPSHPELLAWLARDMAEHKYDLRAADPRHRAEQDLFARRAAGRGETHAGAVAVRRRPPAAADADADWPRRCKLATTDPAVVRERQARRVGEATRSDWRTSARGLATFVRAAARRLPDRRQRGAAVQQQRPDHAGAARPTATTGCSAASKAIERSAKAVDLTVRIGAVPPGDGRGDRRRSAST